MDYQSSIVKEEYFIPDDPISDTDPDFIPPSDLKSEPSQDLDADEDAKNILDPFFVAGEGTSGSESTGTENARKKSKLFQYLSRQTTSMPKPKAWERVKKLALLRERGQPYTSRNGKLMPAKVPSTGVLCSEECRYNCSDHFSDRDRQQIMFNFYQHNANGKNAILLKNIKKLEEVCPKTGVVHKIASFRYSIRQGGKDIRVCKKALCKLYGISWGKLNHLRDKKNASICAPPSVKKRQHNNRTNKMPPDVQKRIKMHIEKFPAEESPYSRQQKFLSPLLNRKKMFQMYLREVEAEGMSDEFKTTYRAYKKVFNNEFNYSFGYAKSETCPICDSGELDLEHQRDVSYSAAEMEADRERGRAASLAYVTVKLQHTMPLPKINTETALYARQLGFNNLGVHFINRSETAYFLNWCENEGNRGSLEVGSSLFKFFQNVGQLEEVTIWSDTHVGKNFNLIVLYQFLVLSCQVKSINHKFSVVGHSNLDSDEDFYHIEKHLRKTDTINLPDQYRKVIGEAGRNHVVINMAYNFYDLDDLREKLQLVNRKKNVSNQKVWFQDGIRWIRVEKYGSYMYKESLDPFTPFQQVDIRKNITNSDITAENIFLKKIVGNHGSVSEEKKKDLMSLLPYVDPAQRLFYNEIIHKNRKIVIQY